MKQFRSLAGRAIVIASWRCQRPASAQARPRPNAGTIAGQQGRRPAKGVTEKAYVAQCRAGRHGATRRTHTPHQRHNQRKRRPRCDAGTSGGPTKPTSSEGITEKAYVAQCRAGGTAVQTAPRRTSTTAQPHGSCPKQPPTRPEAGKDNGRRDDRRQSVCERGGGQIPLPIRRHRLGERKAKIYRFSGRKDTAIPEVSTYMCEEDASAAEPRRQGREASLIGRGAVLDCRVVRARSRPQRIIMNFSTMSAHFEALGQFEDGRSRLSSRTCSRRRSRRPRWNRRTASARPEH